MSDTPHNQYAADQRPMIRRPGVHRLLVTGIDESQLEEFQFGAGLICNFIDKRGMTAFYTVFDEDLELAFAAAVGAGLTVQQMTDKKDAEAWIVIFNGTAEPWKPQKRKEQTS